MKTVVISFCCLILPYPPDGVESLGCLFDLRFRDRAGVTRFYFGIGSNLPVPADYDGDAADECGIFRAGSGLWAVKGLTFAYYGSSGDVPVIR